VDISLLERRRNSYSKRISFEDVEKAVNEIRDKG
jgi:hypothetical protein